MFAVIQLKNLSSESIYSKLDNYAYLGSFETVLEIENQYKNYYAHKYRLKDHGWCYFVRKAKDTDNVVTDSHLLADRVIFDLEYEFKNFYDYQVGYVKGDGINIISKVLRDIKLNMIGI